MSGTKKRKSRELLLLTLLIPATGWAATAADQQAQMETLLSMDFKDLAEIHLTSAARQDRKLIDTTTAITVIDQEEIRRSRMTSIPEILRMVPGLEVARINGSNWAITSWENSGDTILNSGDTILNS